MAKKEKTPRIGNCNGVKEQYGVNRKNETIISQAENWERGTRWAGIALVLMFVAMSLGSVIFGW
jgi:hypothetical protein